MELKPGVTGSSDDFWYDIFDGGYIKPEDYLALQADIENVKAAIEVLLKFRDALEDVIEEA